MIVKPNVSYPFSITRSHELITKLSDAYDELKALYNFEIGSLKATDLKDVILFGLTPAEGRVLDRLTRDKVVTTEMLVKVGLRRKESVADRPENVVRVIVLRLRKKLAPYGVKITNIQGVGYSIAGLDAARELAEKGARGEPYSVNENMLPVAARRSRWFKVLCILQEHGPISIQGIVNELNDDWPVGNASKTKAIRAYLRRKEYEGGVLSIECNDDGKRKSLWRLSNT